MELTCTCTSVGPLPSAMLVRALDECAPSHDGNILREGASERATSSDGELFVSRGELLNKFRYLIYLLFEASDFGGRPTSKSTNYRVYMVARAA